MLEIFGFVDAALASVDSHRLCRYGRVDAEGRRGDRGREALQAARQQ